MNYIFANFNYPNMYFNSNLKLKLKLPELDITNIKISWVGYYKYSKLSH